MWGRLSSLAQTVQGMATEEEETAEGATVQQPVCSMVYYNGLKSIFYHLKLFIKPFSLKNYPVPFLCGLSVTAEYTNVKQNPPADYVPFNVIHA